MTTVSGIIRDTQGNALPALSVTIRYTRPLVGFNGGAAVQNTRSFVTNGAGLLTMAGLVPGHYEIFISIQVNDATSVTLLQKGTITVLDQATQTLESALDANVGAITPNMVQQAIDAAEAAAASAAAAAISADEAEDWAEVAQAAALDIGDGVIASRQTFTGDGTTNALTLSVAPVSINNVWVFVDGVHQPSVSLSGTALSPVGFSWPSGANISVQYFTALDIAGLNIASIGGLQDELDAGIRPEVFTSAQIADAAHSVNTTFKTTGKTIYDSTNNRLLSAGGAEATSPWYVGDGVLAITPV